MPQVSPTVEEHLLEWLPAQRWFTGKSEPTTLTCVGGLVLPDPTEQAQLISYLYRVDDAGPIIHVPITVRDEQVPALADQLIGESQRTSRRNPAKKYFYDGTADPAFVTAWLHFIHNADQAYADRVLGQPAAGFGLWPAASIPDPEKLQLTAQPGEQSNTSVQIRGALEPFIIKFFRNLTAGNNQDVEVGLALDSVRSGIVATTYGTISASWAPEAQAPLEPVPVKERQPENPLDYGFGDAPEPQPSDGAVFNLHEHFAADGEELVTGQLCVLRHFYAEAKDAWSLASLAAVRGYGFTVEAEELGRTLAQLHKDLGIAFGAQEADEQQRTQLLAELAERLRWGYQEAEEIIGDHRPELEALIEELVAVEEISQLQRIHSDLHLGQIIRTDGHHWRVIDFEGEPLRAGSGVNAAGYDIVERDLAGMLRSFDYAAALAHRVYFADQERATPALTQEAARHWSQDCARAFLRGYSAESGVDVTDFGNQPIQRALLLDKALYEVAYELSHRQDWVHVPALAAQRLLGPATTEPAAPSIPDPVPAAQESTE